MNAELKSLIEDAAKLLGLPVRAHDYGHTVEFSVMVQHDVWTTFNPRDPERGDLMKVAMAAELMIEFKTCRVWETFPFDDGHPFTKDDHDSLAIAVLRAASAVLKARGE